MKQQSWTSEAYVWTSFTIGGKISKEAYVELLTLVDEYIDEGDDPLADWNGPFGVVNPVAYMGKFPGLEEFCQEHELSYIRCAGGEVNFTPEIVFWVPGMEEPFGYDTNVEGSPMVEATDVRWLLEHGKERGIAYIFSRLTYLSQEVPKLPPFEIEGVPR